MEKEEKLAEGASCDLAEEPKATGLIVKYTKQDIDRIFKERVKYSWHKTRTKAGLICEWSFEYPNGNITAQVCGTWPMNEKDADFNIAKRLLYAKIKDALWEICGKYTLATGIKL